MVAQVTVILGDFLNIALACLTVAQVTVLLAMFSALYVRMLNGSSGNFRLQFSYVFYLSTFKSPVSLEQSN